MSIGQLCDDNYIAIFSKNHLNNFKNKELVLKGKCNEQDVLWGNFVIPEIKN